MGYREPFTVFRRTLPSGKHVYYYQARTETGERTSAWSTGCRTKKAARTFCHALHRAGRLVAPVSHTFSEYTHVWFVYEQCPYIQARLARGHSYSRQHAHGQRTTLVNHMIPAFGAKKIEEITTRDAERYLKALRDKGYSPRTVNYHLAVLRLIFSEAERLGDVAKSPLAAVKPFGGEEKQKGVLTTDEVARLFAPGSLGTVWGGNRMQRLLNLTASLTGLRMGELQALRREDVLDDHLHVRHGWDRTAGLKVNNPEHFEPHFR